MTLSKLFKKGRSDWGDSKQYLKSAVDLRLLPEQVMYVEGCYNDNINKIVSKKHNEICLKIKSSKLSAEFIYLPFVAKQLQHPTSLLYILRYYFPNIDKEIFFRDIPTAFRSDTISQSLFSSLAYNGQINSGFFRYVGKDKENLYIYEYFSFVGSSKFSILKQIDYYISSIFEMPDVSTQLIVKEEDILFGDIFREERLLDLEEQLEASFPKDIVEKPKKDSNFLFCEKRAEGAYKKVEKKEEKESSHKGKNHRHFLHRKIDSLSQSLFDDENEEEQPINSIPPSFSKKEEKHKKQQSTEHELISQIKSDIQDLKELGFYELLIKELGRVLFEQDTSKMFLPSRLFMDKEFRIYLSDFDNLEVVMTPLPKTLFILFLRHPEGINLKSLIDYKKELLEIYKLLSYRETYFDMVESVNRICNPFEGSINEKLSRIKEAFLKKMSIDTAKYYIITGERGMKKRIEIDRSLIELPNAFEEIEKTKVL